MNMNQQEQNQPQRSKRQAFTSTSLLNIDMKDRLEESKETSLAGQQEILDSLKSPPETQGTDGERKIRHSTTAISVADGQLRNNKNRQVRNKNINSPDSNGGELMKKSDDTLMFSQTGGVKFQNSQSPMRHENVKRKLNQTGIFKDMRNKSNLKDQITEQHSSSNRPTPDDFYEVRQTHKLGSLKSERFGNFSQKNRQKQRYGAAQLGFLSSQINEMRRSKEASSPTKSKKEKKFDMSVGIKANGTLKKKIKNVVNHSNSLSPVAHSLRKTITLDLQGSRNNDEGGELTISVNSGNRSCDKLNSSVETSDFLGVVQDQTGKTRLETRHPTVVQIIDTQQCLAIDPINDQSSVENLILATSEASRSPRHLSPRTGGGKINQETSMLDHLLNTCDDEGFQQQNQEQSLEMIKLRKVLMTAMQMNQTSVDKKWTQMTPFERAKIKECFSELLRDLNKQELRTQRARGILDSGTEPRGGAAINLLNKCLTSQKVKKQQRPLPGSHNIDFTWDGIITNSPKIRAAGFQMPSVVEDSFILVENIPSSMQHLMAINEQKLSNQFLSYESLLPKFGTRQLNSHNSEESVHSSIKVSLKNRSNDRQSQLGRHFGTHHTNTKSQATEIDLDAQGPNDNNIDQGNSINIPTAEAYDDTIVENTDDSLNLNEEQFAMLMTQMRVSMQPNTKAQNIDLSTANGDNNSIGQPNAAMDIGRESVLNSTLLSFLTIKQENNTEAAEESQLMKQLEEFKVLTLQAQQTPERRWQNVDITDVQQLTTLPQPVVELPRIIKILKDNKISRHQHFSPIKEEPSKIVESTLQAISLSRLHQEKQEQSRLEIEAEQEKQEEEEQMQKNIKNEDQYHLINMSDKDFKEMEKSQELIDKGMTDESIENPDMQNIFIKMKNATGISGGLLNSQSKFSETFGVRSNENIMKLGIQEETEKLNKAQHVISGEIFQITTGAHRLQTRDQLSSQSPSNSVMQPIHGAKFDHQPSLTQQQIHQIDSATEKSSLYPQYMLSKLDPALQGSPIKKMKRIKVIQTKALQAVSPVLSQAIEDEASPMSKHLKSAHLVVTVNASPVSTNKLHKKFSVPPQRQNRAFRGNPEKQQEKRSSALVGWENPALAIGSWSHLHGQSSVDMFVHLQSQMKKNSSRAGLQKYNSIEAKLQLLEARIAEHDLENMLVVQPQANIGQSLTPHDGSKLSSYTTKYSTKLTHAALRRSALNKKSVSPSKDDQLASLKLCGIRGTSKDLKPLNYKSGQVSGQGGSPRASKKSKGSPRASKKNKVVEKGEIAAHDGGVSGGGGKCTQILLTVESKIFEQKSNSDGEQIEQLDQEETLQQDESPLPQSQVKSPQLVNQCSGLPYAEESELKSRKKPQIRLTLEEPQQKPIMTVSFVNAVPQPSQDDISNSDLNIRSRRMRGTQAYAPTPSKVSESLISLDMQSGKPPNTILSNKKHTMPDLIENTTQHAKMNQTTTSAFSPPGADQFRMELKQAIFIDALVATTNSDETGADNLDQQLLKNPFQDNALRTSFLINELATSDGISEEATVDANQQVSMRSQARSPMIKEHDFSGMQLATSSRTNFANRSQSLAPPIAKINQDHSSKGSSSQMWKGAVSSLRKRSMFLPPNNAAIVSPSRSNIKSKVSMLSKKRKTLTIAENSSKSTTEHLQIFDPELAPRQQLPKMKNPSLIEPSVGLKQDLRTPLHKLLTSEQLEEFQSLLGSKQKWRKFNEKVRKGADQTDLPYFSQQTKIMANVNQSQLQTSQLPAIPKSTDMQDFLEQSFSKQKTAEHIRRVKNVSAARQTKVVFVDPVNGMVNQPLSPQGHMSRNKQVQQMLKTNNSMMMTRSRASPFQTGARDGSQSIASPQTTNITPQPNIKERARNLSSLSTTMPAVSTRYQKSFKSRTDVAETFIFNDVNNLKNDLRKNQAIVYPIFKSKV